MNIMSQTENKIFVLYIGVAGIRSEDIPDYVHKVAKRIAPQSVEGESITIPVQSYDSRIECINPIYITDKKLIIKHDNLMKELHIELEHQIKKIKNEKED